MALQNWMKTATAAAQKPKESVIGVLKKNMGGYREGRARSELHASDITKEGFCPRRWALNDIAQKKTTPEYVNTSLRATFDIGSATAKVLIENWAGDAAIGNWICLRCKKFVTLGQKPPLKGCGLAGEDHIWQYEEFRIAAPEYAVSGGMDLLMNLGTAFLRVIELKIMAPDMWEKLVAPLPEHRLRTALYLKLIAESDSPFRSRFNTSEGTVLYVSRTHGRMNSVWSEVLPFKEFSVPREDELLKAPLQQAKSLKIFRETKEMPTGICATAADKYAKKCDVCTECFGGQYPAKINWQTL
jgi:hypothetical protein